MRNAHCRTRSMARKLKIMGNEKKNNTVRREMYQETLKKREK